MNKDYDNMSREQLVKAFDKALNFIVGFYITAFVCFIVGMIAFVHVNVKLDKANKTIKSLCVELNDAKLNNSTNDSCSLSNIDNTYTSALSNE